MLQDNDINITKKLEIYTRFGYSSSENFKHAVELAKNLPNYKCSGQDRIQEHTNSVQVGFEDDAALKQIMPLLRLISNWKNKKITISNITLHSYWEFEKEYNEVKDCYKLRNNSCLGVQYCFGKDAPDNDIMFLGCRFIKSILPTIQKHYYYQKDLNWYQFGNLSEDLTSFNIDKDKILTICMSKTKGSICTICPFFDWQRIKMAINDLPDKIIIDEKSLFEIKYSALDSTKPIGIQLKNKYPTQLLNLGYTKQKEIPMMNRNVPSVKYSDIAGQDKAISIIKSVIQLPLTQPEYFLEMGIEPHRGVIFYGPPGNGKTLIAKAVATESDAHLEIINGPEILSKWVGQSEENLRNIFIRAKQLEPSIVLIDEIDSIAPKRDNSMQQHSISLISQLLVLLDGLESRGQTLVIGTTNRFDALDPAILRPGRFDYHINIPMPDEEGRKKIMLTHLMKLKVAHNISIDKVCENLVNFSGAEIAAVVREAGLVAIDRGVENNIEAKDLVIDQNDLNLALIKIKEKRKTNE